MALHSIFNILILNFGFTPVDIIDLLWNTNMDIPLGKWLSLKERRISNL